MVSSLLLWKRLSELKLAIIVSKLILYASIAAFPRSAGGFHPTFFTSKPQPNSQRRWVSLSPFFRWENWGSEKGELLRKPRKLIRVQSTRSATGWAQVCLHSLYSKCYVWLHPGRGSWFMSSGVSTNCQPPDVQEYSLDGPVYFSLPARLLSLPIALNSPEWKYGPWNLSRFNSPWSPNTHV